MRTLLILLLLTQAAYADTFNACLKVEEEDESPSNIDCRPLRVPNNSLTDNTDYFSLAITNVATATALAANPTDCAANQFANTIAANGNLSCAAIADADIPDTITASSYLPLAGGTLSGNLGVGLAIAPSAIVHVREADLADTALFERTTTSISNAAYVSLRTGFVTTQDAANEFGSCLGFTISDTGVTESLIGTMCAVRNAGDTTGDLIFNPFYQGTGKEALRVSTNGMILVNDAANSASAGAGIQVFTDDNTAVVSGDRLGFTTYGSDDGAGTRRNGAAVNAYADGTWSATSIPSKLTFETAASGSTTRTVRVTIDAAGLATFSGAVTSASTITSSATSSLGWSNQSSANQACNTTCTSACVDGYDNDAANFAAYRVGCASAVADSCLCAGSS